MANTNCMTLLIALSALIVVFMDEGGAAIPQTSSLSAVEYWANALPSVPLPTELRQRVSPLDGVVAHLYQGLLASGGLCSAGHLYCNAQKFSAFRKVLTPCNVMLGFRHPEQSSMLARESTSAFFRENALIIGTHMILDDHRDRAPMAAFLPSQLAETLFPASAELLHVAFGIPAESLLSKESVGTSKMCLVKTQKDELLQGEEAFCALSLEDLADQLKVRFSEKVELLPVSIPASHAQATSISAKLAKVELRVKAGQPYLICHAQTYPFAVHFCHHIPNTRIYSVTLQSMDPHPEFFQAVAICHLDTSGWSSRHSAFADLHSTPGHTDACHWTHQHGLVFVPATNV